MAPDATREKKSSHRLSSRRQRVARLLKGQHFDAMVVTHEANVRYLTGFTGDDTWLVITPSRAILISDRRFEDQIRQECPELDCDIRGPGAGLTLATQTAKVLSTGRWKNVGFEKRSMNVGDWQAMVEACPPATFLGTEGLVEEGRMIKDASEIETLRRAIDIAQRAFHVLRATERPGTTEKQMADLLEGTIRELGGQGSAFPPIVAVGDRAALPHARPTTKRREESPLMLVDWGARVDFYNSDLTRVMIRGKPAARLTRIYQTVLRAQKAAIAAIRPGVACGEIDTIARGIIEDAGFGRYFGHSLGHGLGLCVHEGPGLRTQNAIALRPGMVVTVEPGVYVPGYLGVRIEDDVLVTEDGSQTLSSLPKELDEVCHD